MVPKGIFAALFGAALVASSASIADGYRADEFLKLDLSQAALSPRPLGPPAQFEPIAVEAKTNTRTDAGSADTAATVTKAASITAAPVRMAKRHIAARIDLTSHVPTTARTKPARRQTSPLDAQAFDARIQVWPCRYGGICNWQRSPN